MTQADEGRRVAAGLEAEAQSIGALRGSARGSRNVERRLAALSRLGDLQGHRLLEVGCATGEYTVELAKQFDSVDAIDIEIDRLAIFGENTPANITLHTMSITDTTFDDEAFDCVTMIEVLEHLADVPRALAEVRRVLAPGGSLYLTTPNRYWPFEQHGVKVGERRLPPYAVPGITWIRPLHRRLSNSDAFTSKDLKRLAAESGLELRGVTFMMPPLDSLEEGHRLHRITERVEASRAQRISQTIVARLDRPLDR